MAKPTPTTTTTTTTTNNNTTITFPSSSRLLPPPPPPPPPSGRTIFFDSTLDTHLAMLVSLADTVADLKRKVEIEHAISFPEIGRIIVRAIKVRKKGCFYHLADSMPVQSAISWMKETQFLYLEAVPTSAAKHQAGGAQNPTVEDGGNLEQDRKDHSDHKLNVLLGSSGSENCELNEVPVLDESLGKAIIPINQTNSKEAVTFHAYSNSSLSNIDRIVIEKESLGKEKSRERNGVLEETRMLGENCVPDGGVKDVQDRTDLVVDREKDHGQEERRNSSVEANDESTALVVSEKEKSSKESSGEKDESEKSSKEKSGEKNEVLKENRIIDQHPGLVSSPEKKRHKKAKVSSSSEMLLEEPVRGINSQSRGEASELGTVPMEASTHEQHESEMAHSKELTGNKPIGEPALPNYPDDNGKRKKRRRRSSKSSKELESGNQSDIVDAPFDGENAKQFPKAATNDNSLANMEAVISAIEQSIQDNPKEAVENNHEELNKESDIMTVSDKDTRNGANADSADLGLPDPLSTKSNDSDDKPHDRSKDKRDGLSTDVLREDFQVNAIAEVTDLNQEIPSDGNYSKFSKELNDADILTKSVPERNNLEVEPEVPTRSLGRRKKSKNDPSKVSSRKSDPANALDNATEEISKEVDDVRASVDSRDSNYSTKLYTVEPSDGNAKIVKRRMRKDSAKHIEPNDHAIIYSSSDKGKYATEKNYIGTVDDRDDGQDKESKEADVCIEVVAPVDSTVMGFGSPPDKKSRRRRKKASKTELQNQDAIAQEVTDPLGKGVNEEKSKERQENNDRVSAKAHRGTPEDSERTLQDYREDSLGDTHGNASKEAPEAGKYNSSADCVEADEPMVNRSSDSDRINFVDYFAPKKVHEPSPEDPLATEAETMKQNKEKTKRKRKTDINSQSSNPGLVNSSNEQPMIDRKIHDTDTGSRSLVDTTAQQRAKETKVGKASKEKAVKSNSKFDADLGQTSSALICPVENKSQESLSSRKQHRKDANKLKEKMSESEKHKHVNNDIGTISIDSAKEVPQHGNDNALVKAFSLSASASQNNSFSRTDPHHNETITDLVASSDSTEEDTPSLAKRYKVAVRKIPHRRLVNALDSSTQEKTTGASSVAIFHGATSDSSEDESDIINRTAMEATSDSSSTSADSDGDHDVGRQQKGISSAARDKKERKADDGGISLSQSSNGPKKKLPLGTILRSSSSYKKAKLTASQSQADDSESQPVDVVLETQPDLD
ncbi:transcriptional regulator ATRX-like isoform X2 [Ananas comosus]|uniref:Transcriptional regulator ATRX-like isoform X2 n=1 Tax=Ananas comosus TaxID=4615 RepID=A0A6P5H0F2_ANACO|nr:transcriptional regulator ATRX-like isoform X2 [Ananas comosus]